MKIRAPISPTTEEDQHRTAQLLSEALPYIRRFSKKVIVVKYGGNAMIDPELERGFAKDIALLHLVGFYPIVVHGGGPQIKRLMKSLGHEETFYQGMRISDDATMEVVEMVLAGKVNKNIVSLITDYGANAIGITGLDAHFIKTKPLKLSPGSGERTIDLGRVGKVTHINADFLYKLLQDDLVPVIAPIGVGSEGKGYNVNPDIIAGEVARAMNAEKLILMTNTPGVLNKKGELLTFLNPDEIAALITDGTIQDGMLPKIESALETAKESHNCVHIIDGRVPHALLLELFTDKGIGSMILPDGEKNT